MRAGGRRAGEERARARGERARGGARVRTRGDRARGGARARARGPDKDTPDEQAGFRGGRVREGRSRGRSAEVNAQGYVALAVIVLYQ